MGHSNSPAIYTAPWILPMTDPAIRNGAIAVRNGRIEAVGPVATIREAFNGWGEVECRGVLLPALINAHIHLELSHLSDISHPGARQKLCDWIENLIQARGDCGLTIKEKEQCRQHILIDQRRSGVALLADIGNDPHPANLKSVDLPVVLSFQEFLAPTGKVTENVTAIIAELPDSIAATAHAPYSSSPEIICLLKKRATRLGMIFSLHVAESQDEIEFLRLTTGAFRGFLERRGAWDPTIFPGNPSLKGAVEYLEQLGVLDSETLCVHCVHVSDSEVQLLADKGAHVCLCPGSNRFLGVGKAPLEQMLKCGVLPAIGTDSSASNETLDIWREMQIIHEDHPDVEPRKILEMATLGGAMALQRSDDFGSLSPHRKALFLEVNVQGINRLDTECELFDILATKGRPQGISWIGWPND
jgi:aminodeoxyfutalosine deaminase